MSTDKAPNMELRAFLAVVLSLGFMVVYQYFFAPTPPPLAEQPAVAEPRLPPAVPQEAPTEAPEPGDVETAAAEDAAAMIAAVAEQRVVLETERYRMTVTNRGAVISSLVLNDFVSDHGGTPLELVVPEVGGERGGMLRLMTPLNPEVARAANEALYVVTVDGFEPRSTHRVDRPTEIAWQWVDEQGWAVEKRLTVYPDGYLSDLYLSVQNPVETPTFVTLGPGLETDADTSRAGIYLVSGAVLFDGRRPEHKPDSEIVPLAQQEVPGEEGLGLLDERHARLTNLIWGGIQSHFFAALFVPEAPTLVYMDAMPPPAAAEAVATSEGEPTAPQETAGTRARFGIAAPPNGLAVAIYIGPKHHDTLLAEGHSLERAVDYGRFRILARPLAIAMDWVHGIVGNWGVSIILVTFVVRLILWPLSQYSAKSMRRMQQLQPQMNAIKAKHQGSKDVEKRQQMNAEVMQLYKDHGVSPLGGCLPMLVQMPVLFGFYAAVSVAIELRHAPLAGWIHDLSMKDPLYILPVLMGASMYAQQRMSPATGDKTQQMIFRMMPVMFTFFFLTFPSGLVVYWLVNTVLGIAQQVYVNRQIGQIAAPGSRPGPPKQKGSKGKKGGGGKRKKRGKR